MSAGKVLNTGHALYGNITRALSSDVLKAKMIALAGGSDTIEQSEHWVKGEVAAGVTWTAQQGIARNTTNWFSISTAVIRKYDLSDNLQVENSSPFTGLPTNVNHCGDSFADDTYLYVPVTQWSGTESLIAVIAKYNAVTLELVSYFNMPELYGSGCCLDPTGSEILVTEFYEHDTDVPKNKEIKRYNKTTGAFLGTITQSSKIVGRQSITYDPINKYYFIGSHDLTAGKNTIFVLDDAFTVLDRLTPDDTAAEMEGVEYYDGNIYYNRVFQQPHVLNITSLNMYKIGTRSTPVNILSSAEIPEVATILMRITPESLFNYNTILDNGDDGNTWESWVYSDGRVAFRINLDGSNINTTNLLIADQESTIAYTWSKSGTSVETKLGVNGDFTLPVTGTWFAIPNTGLWIGGKNPGNSKGDTLYSDIIVFNKVLSDAELLDANNNFDSFYAAEGVAPTGTTTTIDSVTPTTTTAEVAYSYDNTDETGYKYRVDGGVAVDVGITNPLTITGLTAETEYTVEVLAYTATGDGAYSNPATFTTLPITSTLNMVSTNTPDGTYSADIYNNSTKTLIETRNITFSGGGASEAIPLNAGAELLIFIQGSNPPTTGFAYIGATQ